MKANLNIRLKLYLAVFSVLLSVGIIGFMLFEKMSLTNAVYFSIVTMATVGYGDIHPQTEIGKFLALIIIIGGDGTFLGVIASITDLFVTPYTPAGSAADHSFPGAPCRSRPV